MKIWLLKIFLFPLGCFGGGVSTPPTPLPSPQPLSGSVTTAEDAERQRRRAAASNTVLTGPQGASMSSTGGKSLLGV